MSWEQRWHPLREEWVIVAAHRQQRPWTGNTVTAPAATAVAYDPTCYLCPGNARVSGAVNARYANTFVFDNDHPCVGADAPRDVPVPSSFYRASPAVGVYREKNTCGISVTCTRLRTSSSSARPAASHRSPRSSPDTR